MYIIEGTGKRKKIWREGREGRRNPSRETERLKEPERERKMFPVYLRMKSESNQGFRRVRLPQRGSEGGWRRMSPLLSVQPPILTSHAERHKTTHSQLSFSLDFHSHTLAYPLSNLQIRLPSDTPQHLPRHPLNPQPVCVGAQLSLH